MAVCSQCGQEARSDDLFCQFCGHELTQDLAELAAHEPAPMHAVISGDEVRWQPAPSMNRPVQAGGEHPEQAHAMVAPNSGVVATVVAQSKLIVRSAAEGGEGDNRDEREFLLEGGDVAIGRAPSCDIVLSGDQLASRRHALLRNKGRHYTVVDLGSSNGTYVNDLEIHEETVLHDGDCVKVGGHEIIFSVGAASPHASSVGGRVSAPLPVTTLAATHPSIPSIQLGPAEQSADDAAAGDELPAGSVDRSLLPTHNLQALREQLAELSMVLAEQADAASREADRLRQGMLEMRDLLAAQIRPSATPADSEYEQLITVARQAASDRHLDHVSALAAHAGAIADALEAHRPASDSQAMRETLNEIRSRIDELLA